MRRRVRKDDRDRTDPAHMTYYARRTLEKHGIDPDVVDLTHLLDFSLTYRENFAHVIEPILEQHSRVYQERKLAQKAELAEMAWYETNVGRQAAPRRARVVAKHP